MKVIAIATLLMTVLSPFTQGCSVHMAINQPDKVDLNALEGGGMSRDSIVAKFGMPVSSTKNEDGTRTDVYEFYEGSEPGWKYGRAAFNFAADVFTLTLWELIAWPTEMAIRGNKMSGTATFDKRDILVQFKVQGR